MRIMFVLLCAQKVTKNVVRGVALFASLSLVQVLTVFLLLFVRHRFVQEGEGRLELLLLVSGMVGWRSLLEGSSPVA